MSHRSENGAFTLIEPLMVLAIADWLISILPPVLSSAGKTAQAVACLSSIEKTATKALTASARTVRSLWSLPAG